MKNSILLLLMILSLISCQFSKSVSKDLLSGLTTKGDGLSCEEIFLTINNDKINRSTFIYGEQFKLNFNGIEGFTSENQSVFPGMKILVANTKGDTMLFSEDLYSEYTSGINISPLLLAADITVAVPISSKSSYTLQVNIWDKRGNGTFSAKLDFKVIPNEAIAIKTKNVSYDEVFLFEGASEKVITDNIIRFEEKSYVMFEGLSGFYVENETVFPGLSFYISDKEGTVVLKSEDLFADYTESGLPFSDFTTSISSNFTIHQAQLTNPLHCVLVIWDKKSDSKIEAVADLIIE